MDTLLNRRILVVDDTSTIHEDFRKILTNSTQTQELDALKASLFGPSETETVTGEFELDSAYQGEEGLAKVREALDKESPYAMAFVDMRMPPGWDGIETIKHLWAADPRLQIVICTAYSDYSWNEFIGTLGNSDQLLILKKPFDTIEVLQLANALTSKWQATQEARLHANHLEELVQKRTRALAAANNSLKAEIAERAKVEAGLRLAASVFHNAMNGVMIMDTELRIVSVNSAFTSITGYELEDIGGLTPSCLRGAVNDQPDFDRDLMKALQDARTWEDEIWNQKKDGTPFLARLSVGPVFDTDHRIVRFVGIFNDITELRRKDEYIKHLAFHDALTELPNRTLLLERLDDNIKSAQRRRESFGLMCIDLDRFKSINDALGHDVGDQLLQQVATRLKGCLRRSDTVARMGGDEFVAILPNIVESDHCALVAQKIINLLSEPFQIGSYTLQIGASIGVSYYPEDGTTSGDLLKRADIAMYSAKASGRGVFRFFSPSMSEHADRRLQVEMELRQAIANNHLQLFYQPKISLQTGEMHGVEALVRWRHPEKGYIPPNDFIPLAEDTGLIFEIGDWVMEEACRQSALWQQQGVGRINIAVNISAKQLQRGNLLERLLTLTTKYGVSPRDLELELTESIIMSHSEQALSTLARLREAGATIAMDDFGTGYSSLAYLRQFPIDLLKIDRSFIKNIAKDGYDAEIVKIIINLSKALNIQVVAEGVETEEQAALLQACDCSIAQGYLYSKPCPAGEFEKWLEARKR